MVALKKGQTNEARSNLLCFLLSPWELQKVYHDGFRRNIILNL